MPTSGPCSPAFSVVNNSVGSAVIDSPLTTPPTELTVFSRPPEGSEQTQEDHQPDEIARDFPAFIQPDRDAVENGAQRGGRQRQRRRAGLHQARQRSHQGRRLDVSDREPVALNLADPFDLGRQTHRLPERYRRCRSARQRSGPRSAGGWRGMRLEACRTARRRPPAPPTGRSPSKPGSGRGALLCPRF